MFPLLAEPFVGGHGQGGQVDILTRNWAKDIPQTIKAITAIHKVLEGRLYLSETMKEKLVYSLIGNDESDAGASPIDRLTDRELEVFRLIGQGKATRQIAEQLCLSAKTIETYRSRIKEKLNLSSGSELLRCAFQWASKQDEAWFPPI